jgi:hypothetical protein
MYSTGLENQRVGQLKRGYPSMEKQWVSRPKRGYPSLENQRHGKRLSIRAILHRANECDKERPM